MHTAPWHACLKSIYQHFPQKLLPKVQIIEKKTQKIKNPTMLSNVFFFNGTAQRGWIPQHPPNQLSQNHIFFFQMETYKGGRILYTRSIHSTSEVPSMRRFCYGIPVFRIFLVYVLFNAYMMMSETATNLLALSCKNF